MNVWTIDRRTLPRRKVVKLTTALAPSPLHLPASPHPNLVFPQRSRCMIQNAHWHRRGILAASVTHILSLSGVHRILIVGFSPDIFPPLYAQLVLRSRTTRPGPGASLCSTSKCLDVRGGVLANGTLVQMYAMLEYPEVERACAIHRYLRNLS